jgi:carboxyl-terminal processing protease
MLRKRKFALLGALIVPVVAGGFAWQVHEERAGVELLQQVLQLVNAKYVDTLPASDVYEKAARGLVRELNDPYSELYTPKEYTNFNTKTGGRYGGLGMAIVADPVTKFVKVETVYPNTPAENGGVREGDLIIRVDTQSTLGWGINQVSDSLTGTPGTKVRVSFRRPGVAEPIVGSFTRALIHIPAVPFTLSLGNNIGYIPLQQFNENAAENTAEAIKKFEAQGAKGIILDLRGDPGGILTQSLEIANMFLPRGSLLAAVKGRQGLDERSEAQDAPIAPDIPLIVLTDDRSASAPEIVTGALQDHDRALVVGQTSFGKGLVQSVYNLDGGYAIKLTTGKWFTPSGRSIQRPRKFVNGQFVEETPDTNETNASKKSRPAYKSDAGRVVYGGGGITPDVIVPDDTLTSAEQTFVKAITPKLPDFYTARDDYAAEVAKSVKSPTFTADPAWMGEFYNRLQSRGVVVDRKTYDAASRWIGRNIDLRVAHYAFGDSIAKKRDLPFDKPLTRALDLIQKASTQRSLFASAGEPLPGAAPAKRP